MTFPDRIGRVIEKTLPKLAPNVAEQLRALVRPESLAIIAATIGIWVVSHATGVGEVIDVVLSIVGFFSIGLAVFSGVDELFQFAERTWSGRTDADFDAAAGHLARAIAILGIQTVLALLFKGRPKGGREPLGAEPPQTGGVRYTPKVIETDQLTAGRGGTSFWGDIRVSSEGSPNDRNIVLLHEKVHQFLAPKFYPLRRFRAENRFGSYFKSSLYRYCEEALAESVGQIGTNGMSSLFVGLRFPVKNGYVYLMKGGGYATRMGGAGMVPEGASLIGSGAVQGFAFEVWFKEDDVQQDPMLGLIGP